MTSEYHDLLGGYIHDVWNNGDLSQMDRYVRDDVVCHDPYEPEIRGLNDAGTWVRKMRSTFADSEVRIEDTVVEGEYIACRLRHTGTQVGEFLGREATNARVVNAAMALWRVKDGRFCEVWQHWDALGVSRQIDAASGVQPLADDLLFDPGLTPTTNYSVNESQANKETVQRWMDGAWNRSEFGLVDVCFTEDLWFWDPFGPVVHGREGFREWAAFIDQAFPRENRSLSIDHVIGEGNKTAYRVTIRAKHEGDFMGIAGTGEDVEASAMIIAIHENGCYKKAYQIFDVQKVLEDIGKS